MILLVDIGNTRIKWQLATAGEIMQSLPSGSRVIEQTAFDAKYYWEQIEQSCQQQLKDIQDIAVSCVKPSFSQQFLAHKPQWYSHSVYVAHSESTFLQLMNAYSDPEQMGVDRWLAMVEATQGGQTGAVVVDLGTAITVDWVANNGHHLGGYIIAGVKNQLKALLTNTEKVIASDNMGNFSRSLGNNTQACVTHGVIASIIDFLTLQGKKAAQQGIAELILTGGDAEQVFPLLNQALKDSKIEVKWMPKLLFEGLLTRLLKDRKKT